MTDSNGADGGIAQEKSVTTGNNISHLALEKGEISDVSSDDALLISLGYRPELKREFSFLTAFGQSFGAMGIAPAIAESLIFSLGSAGSVGLVWAYFLGCISLIPVALSLGELGSSMPTAGGLYYWVATLTPTRARALMCWLAGYMNVLGYISIFASTIYGATLLLAAEIIIITNGTWQTTKDINYGLYTATTALCFGITCVPSATLARLNHVYIWLQLAVAVAVIVALPAASLKSRINSATFVFTEFQNTGFWTNDGWAFMLALLTPVWVVSGFESSATIAEEASNAAKAVPFAMVSSLVVALFVGMGVVISIAFSMGSDVIAIVTSPLGQPMAQICLDSLGRPGAIAMLTVLWGSSICNCSILMVAASRETFALARDGGLPFSGFLRVLTVNKTPARAVFFCAIITLVEGLLMFVNTIAINSIFNLAIMGLYFAYTMPLVSRLVFDKFKPGVWHLGRTMSFISALYSVLWMTFIFILLLFPAYPRPDETQMNYAVAVFGAVLLFCLGYYYFPKYGGKTFFHGPVRTVDENRFDSAARGTVPGN
ncbi:GABA-specific high-affinity permease [Orbilia brochopaga]|uniref:GABA-specific high-affinity permease n=1 Tax=Orbilia brochopaga TaxID=3140254 RepID=A0AAV9TZF8_9PEZI